MAIPTVTLNETNPSGDKFVRDGNDRIIEYKKQNREILEIDHFYPSSGQSNACGRHKRLTLMEAADIGAVPATWVGTEAIVYLGAQTVSGKPELCYTDEDDTDVLLTDVGKIALQNGRLPNNTYLIARNAAGAANINMFKVNASDIIEFATFPITPSAAPDADYEVANMKYVKDSRVVIQVVNTQTGAVATGTTIIPVDDTIPQITEGDEYMTLAITPTSATNKLLIRVVINLANSVADSILIAALFQDATANALKVASNSSSQVDNTPVVISFEHYMVAGTTSETTFRVRGGATIAGTTTFNGAGGARKFGGVMASSITITEIAA